MVKNGDFIEIEVRRQPKPYFYHGYVVSQSKNEIKILDVKEGENIFSKDGIRIKRLNDVQRAYYETKFNAQQSMIDELREFNNEIERNVRKNVASIKSKFKGDKRG